MILLDRARGEPDHTAGRTNKRFPLFVFLVAGLLTHQHDARPRRAFARHDLRRIFAKRTAGAFFFGGAQCGQRFNWRRFSHKSLRRRNDVAASPVPLEVLPDPVGLHVLAPVADVPFAPGAEAAKLVSAVVDRHVDD